VGPERLSVCDIKYRTKNILESYHAAVRRRIQVLRQNLFVFLRHPHRATVDYMSDRERVENGLLIRRPRRKQLKNDCRLQKCFEKYNNGDYSRVQFLRAVSHNIMHAQPLQIPDDRADDAANDNDTTSATVPTAESIAASSDTSDCCEVCLLQKREDVALVPCGHYRFCGSCADTVASLDRGCPICHTPIRMVLRLFS